MTERQQLLWTAGVFFLVAVFLCFMWVGSAGALEVRDVKLSADTASLFQGTAPAGGGLSSYNGSMWNTVASLPTTSGIVRLKAPVYYAAAGYTPRGSNLYFSMAPSQPREMSVSKVASTALEFVYAVGVRRTYLMSVEKGTQKLWVVSSHYGESTVSKDGAAAFGAFPAHQHMGYGLNMGRPRAVGAGSGAIGADATGASPFLNSWQYDETLLFYFHRAGLGQAWQVRGVGVRRFWLGGDATGGGGVFVDRFVLSDGLCSKVSLNLLGHDTVSPSNADGSATPDSWYNERNYNGMTARMESGSGSGGGFTTDPEACALVASYSANPELVKGGEILGDVPSPVGTPFTTGPEADAGILPPASTLPSGVPNPDEGLGMSKFRDMLLGYIRPLGNALAGLFSPLFLFERTMGG